MVCADLEHGTFMETAGISKMVATRQPYKEWLQKGLRRLSDLGESTYLNEPMYEAAIMLRMQAAIGALRDGGGGRSDWARVGT